MILENNKLIEVDKDSAKVLDRLSHDFRYFSAACLRIVNKQGELVPLVLNKAQEKLLMLIRRQEKVKKPVRIIIVKARQLGMSTFIAAYFFWKTLTKKHRSSLIVADEIKDAQGLLNKSQIFYDNLPGELKPPKKYRTKKEIYFDKLNSSIEVDTASNESLGRSRTFQMVHMSECAFYPNQAEKAMLSLKQTVPLHNETYVILESTANGLDNMFYEEVRRAQANESEYEIIFLPWYTDPQYRLGEDLEFDLTDKEKEIKKKFKLDYAQLRWRRYTIANQCGDSEEKFMQEYPSTVDEAFQYSGHPVFNPVILKEMRNTLSPIEFIGSVNILKEELEEKDNGELEIYKWPKEGHVYSIGIDPALGIEDQKLDRDYTVICGVDAFTKEQVFQWRGRVEWDRIAHIAVLLARHYNDAYLVPEGNNHGLAVISKIRDLHYPFLYKERDYAETGLDRKERIGFLTTSRSKPMIISHFVELFREKLIKVNSIELLEEMSKFTQDKRGRMRGTMSHDDTVMAMALALWGTRYAPVILAVEDSRPKKIDCTIKFKDLDKISRNKFAESDWVRETFPYRFQ